MQAWGCVATLVQCTVHCKSATWPSLDETFLGENSGLLHFVL